MFSYFEMKKCFEDNGCMIHDISCYKGNRIFYAEKAIESFYGLYDENKREIVYCCVELNEMLQWLHENYDTSSFNIESKECIRGGKTNNIIGEYYNIINIKQSNVTGDNIIGTKIGTKLENNTKIYTCSNVKKERR